MNPISRAFILTTFAACCTMGGFFGYVVLSLPDVSELQVKNPEQSAFMQYRLENANQNGDTLNIFHNLVALEDIPKLLQRTVVLAEDAAFWVHEGIDWHEVQEALNRNLEEGKIIRGASTITQQTAKNLFLSPRRNYLRKFREYLITQDLERHLSKSRILELYLNYIEFGSGIFGIDTASKHFFNSEPSELTLAEMVRLAAIIPAPLELDPTVPNGGLKWRSRVILNRLKRYSFISKEQYMDARYDLSNFFGSF